MEVVSETFSSSDAYPYNHITAPTRVAASFSSYGRHFAVQYSITTHRQSCKTVKQLITRSRLSEAGDDQGCQIVCSLAPCTRMGSRSPVFRFFSYCFKTRN